MHYSTRFSAEETRSALQSEYALGISVSDLGRKYQVSRTTVYRWLDRPDNKSRSSRPLRQPRRLALNVEQRILAARAQRKVGPDTLSHELRLPASTIYKVLRRYGVNRLVPQSKVPAVRYEAPHPGALLHIDVKKLASHGLSPDPSQRRRWHGADCLHVAIDDHPRVGYWEVLPNELAETCAAFLERAVRWYASLGVTTERVLTDRHPSYRSERWELTCRLLVIRPLRTRPRRPQTNGKCERLIRTIADAVLRDRIYDSREARTAALANFQIEYNTRRRHLGIDGRTPFQRLVECTPCL